MGSTEHVEDARQALFRIEPVRAKAHELKAAIRAGVREQNQKPFDSVGG